MAYVQYTRCTPTNNFSRTWSQFMNKETGPTTLLASGLLAVLFGAAVPVVGPAVVLTGSALMFTMIVASFEYLLGGKLICLGGDKIAIGRVLSTEPPELKEFPSSMDNDLSINLLLCPNERLDKNFLPPPPAIIPWPSWKLWPTFFNDYEIPDTTMTNGFQDFLVKEQVQSSAHNCPFSGYPAEEELPPDPPQPAGGVNNSAINHANFHIELEGSRIHSMYLAFLAAWAMLSIAGIAAAVVASVPVIGCLLAAVIILSTSVIAASILAIAWFAGPDGSTSDPNRIPGTGAVGELHPGDYLVAFGTWVYDAGHNDDEHKPYPKKLSDGLTPNPLYGVDNPLYNKEEKKGMPNQMGWNELHPVKYLGKAYQCADQKQAEEWEHLITESLEYKVEEVIHLLESAWRFHPLVG